MDQEFEDEIDRDLLENGPGEPPFIRLAKAEQSVRGLTAERDQLRAEVDRLREQSGIEEDGNKYLVSRWSLAEQLTNTTARAEASEKEVERLRKLIDSILA